VHTGTMNGGTLGGETVSTSGGAAAPWLIVLPGVLGIITTVALIVVDLGGLIMGSWGPQPGLGWLKSDLTVNLILVVVAAVALFSGLSAPGVRRAAILVAWLVIPAGLAIFLIAVKLTRNAA
jgi:hypothetical protein